jgi:hypothetical protein
MSDNAKLEKSKLAVLVGMVSFKMNISFELKVKDLFRIECWGLVVGFGEYMRIWSIYIENECSICCSGSTEKFDMVTPCGHYYHKKCLNTWLCIKKRCPLCNSNLKFVEDKISNGYDYYYDGGYVGNPIVGRYDPVRALAYSDDEEIRSHTLRLCLLICVKFKEWVER